MQFINSDGVPVISQLGGGGGGITNIRISAGTTSNLLSAVTFSNSNGVSFGINASTITASHNGLTSQSTDFNAITLGGNTAGDTTFHATNTRTIFLNGGANITLSGNAGTITIIGAAGGGGLTNINVSAGTTSQNLSNIVFSNSNNVSFGLNGSTITATATVASTQGSINISAGTTSNLASAFTFSNSNGISFGLNASTVTASHNGLTSQSTDFNAITLGGNTAGTTTFHATNTRTIFLDGGANITLSGNGGTITIIGAGGGGGITYSGWNPLRLGEFIFLQKGQGTLFLQPHSVPAFQFDQVILPIFNTNSSNSSGSHTLSFWVGIYTRNVSTLSLLMSTSATTAVTHSGSVGSYSLYSGYRNFNINWTNTINANNIWVGILSRTTSGGANGTYSQAGVSNTAVNYFGPFGSSNMSSRQQVLGLGQYSATTSSLPNSIAFTQLDATGTINLRVPMFHFGSATI